MKKRTITSFLLITILVLGNVIGGFAAIQFSDVGSNHWAYKFINDVAEKEIVNGYFDDNTLSLTFKPDKSVTYVEAIQFIYSTLKSANIIEKDSSLTVKYQSALNNNGIPSWAHEAMAYALENNIVLSEELSVFIKNAVQSKAQKEDIAVYLGKALDLNKEINPRPAIVPTLMFNDAEMITRGAKPYVIWLVNKGILAGDDQNKFNPSKIITRAEMATMCSKAYDLLERVERVEPTQPTNPTTPIIPSPSTETTLERIVDYVADDADTIIVMDADRNREIYKLESYAVVVKGNSIKRIADIKQGDRVKLYFDNDKVTKVEINTTVTDYNGYIESISDEGRYHLITVRDKFDLVYKKTFRIDDSTIIEKDHDDISVNSLRKDDLVTIEYIGDTAIEIEVDSQTAEYTGILESRVIFKANPTIKVRVNNNDILELVIDDNAYIRKDRSRAYLDDLDIGDIVTIKMKDGKVDEIRATSRSVDRDDEGVIKALTLGNPSELTIKSDDDGTENTYVISNTAYVEIDDDDAEIYELRPNYYVELKIKNNQITEIIAEKVKVNNVLSGTIVKVYKDYDRLTLKYIDSKTQNYETRSIIITDDTNIISSNADRISLSQLVSGDEVFIDGYYDDDWYIANKIIQLDE